MSYGELVDRVMRLTNLAPDDASHVATELWKSGNDEEVHPREIINCARALGYEVEHPEGAVETEHEGVGPEISMDPSEVLTEVYMDCPRCLPKQEGHDSVHMPRMGRAPDEAQQHFSELLEEMPEEARALLVKIDLFEHKATFWVRDEANEIDRPIGPIDLRRYTDGQQLMEAFMTLLKPDAHGRMRMDKVLAADWN